MSGYFSKYSNKIANSDVYESNIYSTNENYSVAQSIIYKIGNNKISSLLIFSGVAVLATASFYLYKIFTKLDIYNYNQIVHDYLEDLREIALKHDLIPANNSKVSDQFIQLKQKKIKNLPLEILAIIILVVKEMVEEMYYEENRNSYSKRAELLKQLKQDESQDYYTEVLEMIDKKEELLNKAFNCLEQEFWFVNKESVFKQIENCDVELFKKVLSGHYKYIEPKEVNDPEYEYYNKVKVGTNNLEKLKQFFSLYYQLSSGVSDLIIKKKKEDAKIDINNNKDSYKFNNSAEDNNETIFFNNGKVPYFKNDSIKILLLNQYILHDTIYLTFGIRIHHFLYLLKNNENYNKCVEMKMLMDSLEEKDNFIEIYPQ